MDQREDHREPVPPTISQPWLTSRQFWTIFAVFSLLVLAVLALVQKAPTVVNQDRNFDVSVVRAHQLLRACETYRLKSSSNSYPTKLADVVRYLEDPSLADSLGNPFHYALVPNADGELEPYIWVERVRDGKTTLSGAKRTAEGKEISFGLTDD